MSSHRYSQVFVIVTDSNILRLLQLLFVLCDQRCVDLDLRGLCELPNKLQVGLIGQAARKPQERLLEVVVAPCAQIVVLEISLPVELNVLRLRLAT